MTSPPSCLYPKWDAPDNVVAYITTKTAGNMGIHVGNEAQHVISNRSSLPYHQQISWLDQIHSDRVVDAKAGDVVKKADAQFTEAKHVFCAVMTADCVPILLCTVTGKKVACIHAGWRGLASGIIAKTLARFDATTDSLVAYIGPCISSENYEVEASMAEHFSDFPGAFSDYRGNKVNLDLSYIASAQLSQYPKIKITQSKYCTYRDSDVFYSHRFATHNPGSSDPNQIGRFASVIGIL